MDGGFILKKKIVIARYESEMIFYFLLDDCWSCTNLIVKQCKIGNSNQNIYFGISGFLILGESLKPFSSCC